MRTADIENPKALDVGIETLLILDAVNQPHPFAVRVQGQTALVRVKMICDIRKVVVIGPKYVAKPDRKSDPPFFVQSKVMSSTEHHFSPPDPTTFHFVQ